MVPDFPGMGATVVRDWLGSLLALTTLGTLTWALHPRLRRGRAYAAALRRRPALADDEFNRLVPGGGPADDVPARVRRVFAEQTGYPADRLLPDDDFAPLSGDMDRIALVMAVEQEFGIRVPPGDAFPATLTIRATAALVRRTAHRTGGHGGV